MTTSLAATRREALGLFGGAAAAGILATPAFAFGSGEQGPWTSGGTLPVVGGKLSYVSMGEGAPIILLHKLGGWVADWRHIAPLIKSRRVIAFDLAGHGASKMYGPAPHIVTVEEGVAMLITALDQLGVKRFDLLGNSVGGVVSILMAAQYPDRVNKLALISTMMSDPVTREALAAREAGGTPVASPIRSAQEQAARFGTIDPRISEEQAAANRVAGEWKSATERGAAILGSAHYLPRIKAPTLLLTADRGAYVKYNEVAKARLPGVQVVEMANTGSFIHQERPADAAAILNKFLAD